MTSSPHRSRLTDVAREAGVSVTTASDALRGSSRVRTATKEKVREAALRLSYTPNRAAQDLVRQAPSSATVLFSGPESMDFLSNPFFLQLFRPVVQGLSAAGIPVYTEITSDAQEAERLDYHGFGGSSGVIILIGTRSSDAELEACASRLPTPIITVVRHALRDSSLGVAVDNHEIGTIAARHLLDLGHRRVCYIGATPGVGLAEERVQGFREEFARRGVELEEQFIKAGDFYQQSGRLAMDQILDLEQATAVFAANDLMALGALEACQARGIKVPAKMSILGCDDIANLSLLSVPLSSISLPIPEMGMFIAQQAESVLSGEKVDGPVTLRPRLVQRESTAHLSLDK